MLPSPVIRLHADLKLLSLLALALIAFPHARVARAQTLNQSVAQNTQITLPASTKEAEAEIKRLIKEASELQKKGQLEASVKQASRALLILERMPDAGTTDIAESMKKLAWEYLQKDNRTSQRIYEQVLAIEEKRLKDDDLKLAHTFNELGDIYSSLDKHDMALQMYKRALPIFEKQTKKFFERKTGAYNVALQLMKIAETYEDKGDFTQSVPLYQQALEMMEKTEGKDSTDVASVLRRFANSYRLRADYERAEAMGQRALAIVEKKNASTLPNVLHMLGLIYRDKGDYARSQQSFARAVGIYEKSSENNSSQHAVTLFALALVTREKDGDPIKAEPLFMRALSIFDKVNGKDSLHSASVLRELSNLYISKGDYAAAKAFATRVLAIRERVLSPQHPDVAEALYHMAAIAGAEGNPERAEQLTKQALSIYEKAHGPEHPLVASVLVGLSDLSLASGDYPRAEQLLQRASAIYQKAFKVSNAAGVLSRLGSIYTRTGDYARAEQSLSQVLEIHEKTYEANNPVISSSLRNLAWLYAEKGDAARAVQLQTRADEIIEHHLSLILTTGSERQKNLYLSTLAANTNRTISLHTRTALQNTAAARLALTTILRRKGRALDATADQIGALRRRLSEADRALLDQLVSTRSQLAAQTLKGPGRLSAEQYRAEIKRLESEAERLEAQVSGHSAEMRAQSQTVTIERVQQSLPTGGVLVEIASYKPLIPKAKKASEQWDKRRYVAYVLAREGDPSFVDLGEAEPIDATIKQLREALRNPKQAGVKQIARALDEQVMRPVRKLIGTARLIFLSPDGDLNLVPFAALVDEQDRYLVESYTIDYFTSGRDLLRLDRVAAHRTGPVIVANPSFELETVTQSSSVQSTGEAVAQQRALDFTKMRISPLPGTASEADALKTILSGAQVLTEREATEEALKRVTAPRILHVATHGFFLSDNLQQDNAGEARLLVQEEERTASKSKVNPLLRSGLVLTGVKNGQSGTGEDGVLTALEASSLDLWGTRLVVLSACETGVGDVRNGDGVYGLRRALVLAGAESQVMSLWQVSDAATRDLMISYYTRLNSGEGRIEALRQVQLEMLRRTERAHPYYWASFIPIGDWRGLDGK